MRATEERHPDKRPESPTKTGTMLFWTMYLMGMRRQKDLDIALAFFFLKADTSHTVESKLYPSSWGFPAACPDASRG